MTSPMDGIFPLFALNAHINNTDDIDTLVEIIEKEPVKFLKNMNSYTEKELLFLFTEAGFDIIRFIYTDYYNADSQFSEGQSVFMVYEYNEDKYLAKNIGNSNNPMQIAVLRDIRCAAEFICNTIAKRNERGTPKESDVYRSILWKLLNSVTDMLDPKGDIYIPILTKNSRAGVFFNRETTSFTKFRYTDTDIMTIMSKPELVTSEPINYLSEWLAINLLYALLSHTGHVYIDLDNDGNMQQLPYIDSAICFDMSIIDTDEMNNIGQIAGSIVENEYDYEESDYVNWRVMEILTKRD